ncbi:MAG TPA: branched-chain amino acid transaminase [Dehalococcoidales bacterium]|nr:MAG: branched-chain-amino-acid transaminase [Chloroflexi bacterium RBG_16_60_22]HJX13562.1 branched-chain amino acid transaminase [Dehalococcoidales bacterium]
MPSYAYFEKKFVPLEEAKIGIMTNSFHYGTAIFEGIRGNWNAEQKQTYIFRLREHYERLQDGCRVLKIALPNAIDELCRLTVELVAKCGFQEDAYVRPVAYKSSQALGVRLHNLEDGFFVLVIPWGPYLDVDKARCCVSSWHRPQDNVIPPQIKAAGIYINNALAKTEAQSNGFDEAIMLSPDGHVSEGSGENLFLVINGQLVTPASYNNILIGITRNTVIELAEKELGLKTVYRSISRSELYTADECFLTGTAAHVTPVAEIDHRKIGDGEIGEITAKLQEIYARVIRGNHPKYLDWCTPVYKR